MVAKHAFVHIGSKPVHCKSPQIYVLLEDPITPEPWIIDNSLLKVFVRSGQPKFPRRNEQYALFEKPIEDHLLEVQLLLNLIEGLILIKLVSPPELFDGNLFLADLHDSLRGRLVLCANTPKDKSDDHDKKEHIKIPGMLAHGL